MEWSADPSHARWLQERIPQLGLMAPTGMEAYARFLNSVEAYRLDDDTRARWRWSDVAERNGRELDSTSEWLDIAAGAEEEQWPDGWHVSRPDEGFIEPALLAAFVPSLRAQTQWPDQIFLAVWEGWGFGASAAALYMAFDDRVESSEHAVPDFHAARRDAADPRLVAKADFDGGVNEPPRPWGSRDIGEARFDLPHRRYGLGVATLEELADPAWPYRSGLGWVPGDLRGVMPQLIWPADETWCLSVEVDAPYTLVAGPRQLIRDLCSLPGIEAQGMRAPRYQ